MQNDEIRVRPQLALVAQKIRAERQECRVAKPRQGIAPGGKGGPAGHRGAFVRHAIDIEHA
jgi:hypothetical protein